MNHTKQMLVMALVWALLGSGLLVCAQERALSKETEKEGLWIEGLEKYYLKGAFALSVSFEAGDGIDGLAASVSSNRIREKGPESVSGNELEEPAVSVSGNDLENISSVSGNQLEPSPVIDHGEGKYTAVFEQPGIYIITATSCKGEVISWEVIVEQDSLAPSFSVTSVVNDSGYTVVDADGIYYFKEHLQVEFAICDEVLLEEVQSPVRLLREGKEIAKAIEVFSDTLEQSGTYSYTVLDEAGNAGEQTIEIMAVKTTDQPSMQISFVKEPIMVGKEMYFSEDPKPIVEVASLSGIAKVEYRVGEREYLLLEDHRTENVCQWGEHTCYRLEHFSDLAEIGRDGVYDFSFRAVDVMGNSIEKSCHFCIDGTAPDPQIFVSYEAQQAAGIAHTGIQSLLRAATDWLFGRTSITFELYVKDGKLAGTPKEAVSGLDLEDVTRQITTANGQAQIQQLKILEEGMAEVVYEGTTYQGYTCIRGVLTLPSKEKEYAADCLKINRLKDRVGNVLQLQDSDYTKTTMLYLDSVNPVLSVEYGKGMIDEKQQKIFYSQDAMITLSLEEAYYSMFTKADGTPVTPKVTVTGGESDRAVVGAWTASKKGAVAELLFPVSKTGKEIEYKFATTYKDGAGNPLLEGRGGTYSEYALVLDQKAPELTNFAILGDTSNRWNGSRVYRHREEEDVTITLSIDDHAAYWNPDVLKIQICDQTTKKPILELQPQTLTWKIEGRIHTTSFSFDGEPEGDRTEYYVTISYQDRAGNLLTNRGVQGGSWTEGMYSSEHFVLDHKAPVFDISYSKAERLVDKVHTEAENDQKNQVPTTGYTAYYKETIHVSISLSESCKEVVDNHPAGTCLVDCSVMVTGEERGTFVPEIVWKLEGERIQGDFSLTEEDCYTISVTYQDLACNPMEGGKVQGSCFGEGVVAGTYTSTDLVLDRTAPVVTIAYTDSQGEVCSAVQSSEDGYTYFAQPVWLNLRIEDRTIRFHEIKEGLKDLQVSDLLSGEITDNNAQTYLEGLDASRIEEGIVTLSIPLTTEGNYTFVLGCTDLAGNPAMTDTEKVSVDWTDPEVNLDYTVEKAGFLDVIRYLDLGYLFADGRMTITSTAQDQISGIQTIRYLITEEDGRQITKTQSFSPSHQATISIDLPLSASDFKGTVSVQVTDWSKRQQEQTYGHVVESGQKHKETSSALLTTLTHPSRTYEGVDYYRSDIQLQLVIKDSYAGLRKVSYTAGKTLSYEMDYGAQKKKEALTYEDRHDLILSALENNENDVVVRAEYEDNTGHTGVVEQHYHIDATPPTLKIEYDRQKPSNDQYYPQARVATVTIQERNFSPEDVEFRITNTEGVMPLIGEFHTTGQGDNTMHTCEVVFAADGDYTFTAACMDLAGNEAVYSRVDEFTIDQTTPWVTVSYDHTKSIGTYYYAKARTATIDLIEHNFDPSCIEITVTAESGAPSPVVSGFVSQEDHHVAKILFGEDGEYTFTVSGTDLAGNVLEPYQAERFLIDQTPPDLEILEVQDRSANNQVVAPLIRCEDVNLDREGIQIVLKGYHNGLQKVGGRKMLSETEVQIQMEDFAYDAKTDDLYTLEVSARDLAGNICEKTVTFSVNRFGSVYTLDPRTEQLVSSKGRYYTNQEQQIVVTETNVDTLRFREVTCNFNGKLRTMTEGVDYTLQEIGTKDGWKQYIYTIDKHNFSEEGTYILTFYSEDRAENTSNNQTKGKKIEFVIDKTSPSIVLSGVETGGQYQENNKEILLDVQDNSLLQEVTVILNDTKRIYHAAELARLDGQMICPAKREAYWQTLQIIACDAAGNESQTEKIRFLLTSNLAVQFFRNPALAGCFFAGVSIIIALGAWICTIFQRRRHHL